jgi:hypothetical protein
MLPELDAKSTVDAHEIWQELAILSGGQNRRMSDSESDSE